MNTKLICCIKGCPSHLPNYDGIRFFGLPNTDKMLLAKWLQTLKSVESPHICSLHFYPSEISANGLCAGALPTLNLETAKIEFLEKVVRQWISENQYHQNISRRTCGEIGREAHAMLNISKKKHVPDWIRNFKYQPMKFGPKGIVRVSKRCAKSGVAEIIKKLTDAERQVQINRVQSVDGQRLTKNMNSEAELHDRKRRKIDHLDNTVGETWNKQNTTAVSNCEESIYKSAYVKVEVLDVAEQLKVEELDQIQRRETYGKAENKALKSLNVQSGSEEDHTFYKSISSNEDALDYLKPLQNFALERPEHSSVIGLLEQLQAIFANRIEA